MPLDRNLLFIRLRCRRRSAGPWIFIGASEERRFTDEVVPSSVASISYRVIATRAGGTSEPTMPATVLFGNDASGEGNEGNEGLTLAA